MTAETSARPPSPRSAYAAASTVACYDCGVPCARSTLACAPLRLRLCHECVRGYSHAAPGQRLIAATSAKFAHRLNDADLASLPQGRAAGGGGQTWGLGGGGGGHAAARSAQPP